MSAQASDGFGFVMRADAQRFPEAWRDIDRAVWRWALAHGGDALLAEVAGWASHAEGSGHSALPLSPAQDGGVHALSAAERAALAASPLVADAAASSAGDALPQRPFVLDGDHLYLLRNHRAEVAVAAALAARRAAATAPLRPVDDEELRALFGDWSDEAERQRAAVRQAVGRRLMVLTGGPGTGKTTTVLRMLLALSREHQARVGALPQVRVAAPTGKAAQRLADSLREGAKGVLALPDDAWKVHLDAVLRAESGTLHRLLGSRGRHGGFTYNAGERLPADIVVVDEASMLDLGMLRALLSALRDDAVLVLVGDADQLTSVGTGSVMMDVVQALEADPRGDLVRLEHCFRSTAILVPVNRAVREGDPAAFAIAWEAASQPVGGGRAAAVLHEVEDAAALRRRLAAWERDLRAVLERGQVTVPVDAADDVAIGARVALVGQQQLLCAQREGPFGAVQAADFIAGRLRRWEALAPWAGRAWYPGRCVMVTRNDATAGLYNGDVGICVPIAAGDGGEPLLQVAFEAKPEQAAAGRKTRLVDPVSLPPHEDAFALTIHKSQGSEYQRVAVLLPPDAESPLLVRQTLYTGLSRARSFVELWSAAASLEKAIQTRLARHGLLARRISVPSG